MIKFFRQIRKKLLAEGKTTNYLKYAIGEIFLVVIGILIALQINNWNTNRINKGKEHEYLVGLKNDLENQIKAFDDRLQIFNFIIDKGESILADFSIKGKLTKIDSINTKLSIMMFALKYPEVKTTFNELSTTSQINLIQNNSLRTQIIKYYQDSEDSKSGVDSNVEAVYYNQIFPIIKSVTIIHAENFNFQTKKVNKDLINEKLITAYENNLNSPSKEFEVVNAISLRVIETKTNKGYIITAKNLAKALLKDIDGELNI